MADTLKRGQDSPMIHERYRQPVTARLQKLPARINHVRDCERYPMVIMNNLRASPAILRQVCSISGKGMPRGEHVLHGEKRTGRAPAPKYALEMKQVSDDV